MTSSLFTPSYYTIAIANATGAAPADGFVDALRVEKYLTQNSDNLPSDFTLVLSTAKRRGNYRYRQILQQLQMMANIYVSNGEILNIQTVATEMPQNTTYQNDMMLVPPSPTTITYAAIVATGSTYKTEATNFSMTVTVERGDGSLYTADELNAGVTLTGTAAIKRCVARAFIWDWTYTTDIYDPTKLATLGTPGSTTNLPRFGLRTTSLTVGHIVGNGLVGSLAANIASAEAIITVSAATTA